MEKGPLKGPGLEQVAEPEARQSQGLDRAGNRDAGRARREWLVGASCGRHRLEQRGLSRRQSYLMAAFQLLAYSPALERANPKTPP